MSESAAAVGDGEGNQQTAGSPAEPSTTPPAAPGSDLAAQLAQTESRRRELQSQLDRTKQENTSLNDRLASLESAVAGIDPVKISDTMFARFAQHQAVNDARSALKDEFPLARADVLKANYQSPEELAAAVKASHESESVYRDTVRQEVHGDIVKDLQARGISVPEPQTQTTQSDTGAAAATSTGEVTIEQFRAMSHAERMGLDDSVFDRLTAQG